MSGHAKRTVYYVTASLCGLLACAAEVFMALPFILENGLTSELSAVLLAFVLTACMLSPGVALHELGHLFFGVCARMKVMSVKIGVLYFSGGRVRLVPSRGSGESQLLPVGQAHVRGRMIATALGGALFNFIYAAVFLALYFALPYHPALLFFELFAPLQLWEGLLATLPATLPAGRTDGAVIRMLNQNGATAKVYEAVLRAQGILAEHTFDDVPEELLFNTPAVQEDEPAFLSLLHLRFECLLWQGKTQEAMQPLSRLQELCPYLGEPTRSAVLCDVFTMQQLTGEESDFSLQRLENAKGSVNFLRAALAAGEERESEYLSLIEKQKAVGTRAFEQRFYQNFLQKKNPSEDESN